MEDVQIVLTVDGFINVYKGKLDIDQGHEGQGQQDQEDQEIQEIRKVVNSFRITPSLVVDRVSDIQLQINVKRWGLMSFT